MTRRTARLLSYADYLQDNAIATDDANARAGGDGVGAPGGPVLAGDVDAACPERRVDVVRHDRMPAHEHVGPRRHAAPAEPSEEAGAEQGDRHNQDEDEGRELRRNAVA